MFLYLGYLTLKTINYSLKLDDTCYFINFYDLTIIFLLKTHKYYFKVLVWQTNQK
jgi:hypothetical protein